MYLLIALTMHAIWAIVFAFSKTALPFSTPLFLTALKTLLAATILLSFAAIRRRSSFKMEKKQWLSLFFLGFFSIYITGVCEFLGLQHLSVAKTCFIFNFAPIFSAIFSYLHFNEKINKLKWTGLGIASLGIFPVLFTQTGSEELFSTNFLSLPTLFVIGAVLSSVYGWVLLRKNLKTTEISPIMANGVSMFFGGGIALIHSLCMDTWNPLPIIEGGTLPLLKLVLIMAILANIIGYNICGTLLKKYTATLLSLIGLLSPPLAAIAEWIFLGEPLSPMIFFATGIVSVGLSIVYYAEAKQGYIPAKT